MSELHAASPFPPANSPANPAAWYNVRMALFSRIKHRMPDGTTLYGNWYLRPNDSRFPEDIEAEFVSSAPEGYEYSLEYAKVPDSSAALWIIQNLRQGRSAMGD
jgi:hypothetical protein